MDRNTINFFQMDFPSWIRPLLLLRHLYTSRNSTCPPSQSTHWISKSHLLH